MSPCGCNDKKTEEKGCTGCPCRFIVEQMRFPRAAFWLVLASVLALGMALTAQFGFDLPPCRLCYIERGPLALTLLFMIIAWFKRDNKNLVVGMFIASSVLLFINSGVAFYQVGVEQHWWKEAVVGCAIEPLPVNSISSLSVEDLRNDLLKTSVVPCDVVTWTLLGLSIATWNIPFCFGLGLFAALAALVIHKNIEIKEGECCCKDKSK